jgi:hypothetical protein
LPVLDFNFGLGLFSSEPLSKPLVVLSLIALSSFWEKPEQNSFSYKNVILKALAFGSALALASYFRGIYTTFANFCWCILALEAVINKDRRKQILLFIVVSMLALSAIQYPWEKRNKHYFGEFTMAASTYHGFSMWHDIWEDHRETAKWGWNAAHGLGNYLAPEKSPQIIARLNSNKIEGSHYAMVSLFDAVLHKPWQAIQYKLRSYDTLWLGQKCNVYIYAWCVLSTISFFIFLYFHKSKFIPGLWLFPMFMLCLSPIIHYEHRYSQAFSFFITPVTAMWVLKYFLTQRQSKLSNLLVNREVDKVKA